MDNRRKIIIVVLIVLTIVIGIGAVIASQLIQNNLTPSGSSAFGFGEAVNKEYFDDFDKTFTGVGCYGILSNNTVNAYSLEGFTELKKYNMSLINNPAEDKLPLSCSILLDSTKSLELEVHTYNLNSAIDPSFEVLSSRVNSTNIKTINYQGSLGTGYFFYGSDLSDTNSCRMNFYNNRNDFEYITVKVIGMDTPCSEHQFLAGEISYILNKTVNGLISEIINPTVTNEN